MEWSVDDMGRGIMTLGERIKQIRLERGEVLEEFGERLSPVASDSNVSRWERGVNQPSPERLKQIAKLGSTTVDELLHGKPSEMTTGLEIMDYYIEHYTKLEHIDTVRKLKEIRVDMENADKFRGSD